MTTLLLILPAAIQGLVLGWDEAHYHYKRGLPRWERVGHPLDALTVVICLLFARLAPWSSSTAVGVYAGLALFSCLFVTKDELVHARECEPGEHWLHALLFLLHPVVLAAAALLWRGGHTGALEAEAAAAALFLVYQAVYWNVIYDANRSTRIRDQQRFL